MMSPSTVGIALIVVVIVALIVLTALEMAKGKSKEASKVANFATVAESMSKKEETKEKTKKEKKEKDESSDDSTKKNNKLKQHGGAPDADYEPYDCSLDYGSLLDAGNPMKTIKCDVDCCSMRWPKNDNVPAGFVPSDFGCYKGNAHSGCLCLDQKQVKMMKSRGFNA